jgi:DNA-binding NarL/FixJ family response regulator
MRVMLVDDHPVVLSGLTTLLASDPDIQVVATARSAAQADTLRLTPAPDVTVVDLRLPDGDGVELASRLLVRWPDTAILILTMHADDEAVIRALAAGAHGYVLKDADPEQILDAVRQVAHGSLVVGPGAQRAVRASAGVALPQPTDPLDALDARDREILELLATGLPTSRVAARLYLAPKTIRNRLTSILAKLGVGTREEAIALARTAAKKPPAQTPGSAGAPPRGDH